MAEYYMKNLHGLSYDNSIDQQGFSKTSRFELLNEEELGFFSNNTKSMTNKETDIGADAKNNRVKAIDKPELTHSAPIIHVDDSRDDISFYNSEPLKPFHTQHLNQHKNEHTTVNLFNKIKLLTMGLLYGLSLSGVMVIVLNKVGILAISIPSETTILMVEHQKQDVAAHANSQSNTQDTLKLSAALIAPQPLIGTAQQQKSHNSSISNEDFQREAQSTLYRDIKN